MKDCTIKFCQYRAKDGASVGSVYVSGVGKLRTKLRVKPGSGINASEEDLERLATIVTIDRVLKLAEGPGASALMPRGAEAALKLVHTLVKLRRDAIMSGKKSDKKDFEKVLNTALQSPNRAVRAVAAASLELLK